MNIDELADQQAEELEVLMASQSDAMENLMARHMKELDEALEDS